MDARKLDELKADLSAFLDGELPPERRREIERALAESDEMRQLAGELRNIAARMSALPRVVAPQHLAATLEQLAAEHLEESAAAPRVTQRIMRLRPVLRWSAVAAVLGVGMFISWRVLLDQRERHASRSPAPEHSVALEKMSEPHRIALSDAGDRDQDTLGLEHTGDESAPLPRGPYTEVVAKSGSHVPADVLPPSQTIVRQQVSNHDSTLERSLSAPAPDHGSAPVVEIIVRTRDAEEYARLSAALGDWPREPANGAQAAAASAAPMHAEGHMLPLIVAGWLPATDLPTRIHELAQAVSEASQVRVNLSFDAAHGDALFVQAARGMLGRPAERDGLRTFEQTQDPPDAEERYFASRAARQSIAAGRGDAPASFPPPESRQSAASPAVSAGGGRAAGRPPPPVPRRGFDDPRAEDAIRRDIAERHRSATQEPVLPEDVLPAGVLSKQGSGADQKSVAPASPSLPASAATEPKARDLATTTPRDGRHAPAPNNYIDRLLGLLFSGVADGAAATQPAEQLGFRVLLMPPEPQPSGAPTSQAGSSLPPR